MHIYKWKKRRLYAPGFFSLFLICSSLHVHKDGIPDDDPCLICLSGETECMAAAVTLLLPLSLVSCSETELYSEGEGSLRVACSNKMQ